MRPSTVEALVEIGLELWRRGQGLGRPGDGLRRLAAQRNNHRVTLLATTVNTVALTIFGAAFITPHITRASNGPYLLWILVALGLHLVAQGLYQFLRAED